MSNAHLICPNCGNTDTSLMDVVAHCKVCSKNNIHAHCVGKWDEINKDNIISKLIDKEKHRNDNNEISDRSYLHNLRIFKEE
jgi:hypothetical protein